MLPPFYRWDWWGQRGNGSNILAVIHWGNDRPRILSKFLKHPPLRTLPLQSDSLNISCRNKRKPDVLASSISGFFTSASTDRRGKCTLELWCQEQGIFSLLWSGMAKVIVSDLEEGGWLKQCRYLHWTYLQGSFSLLFKLGKIVIMLGSSVHGILQARILEWVAILFSRGTSQPRDWTWVSCITCRFFTVWATRGAQFSSSWIHLLSICCAVLFCVTLWTSPTWLLYSRDSPGKNTRVGFHALLQGILPTQGLNLCLLRLLAGGFFTPRVTWEALVVECVCVCVYNTHTT